MTQFKTFSISFFILFCSLIIFKASFQKKNNNQIFGKIEKNTKNSHSRFGELTYPKIFHLKDGIPSVYLSSEVAKINLITDDAELYKPIGQLFDSAQDPINYFADNGYFDKKNSEIKLLGSVIIEESDSSLKADEVKWKIEKDEVFGEGDVSLNGNLPKSKDKILITASKFSYFPKRKISSFRENIVGKIKRREAYREGIDFKTDILDYFSNESRIDLTGNVLVVRKPFSASSRNGQIFFNNQNKLNYFILIDDVKITEKLEEEGKKIERKAFAEKVEGFPDEGKLILTGYPRVFQENEVIKGIRIIVRENSDVVEVEEANTTLKIQKGIDGKNFSDGE